MKKQMKKQKKRTILLLIFTVAVLITCEAFAASFTTSPSPAYQDAINRLWSLDFIDSIEEGDVKPDELLTREQFAKLVVLCLNLGDSTKQYKGISIFSDVAPSRWSNGYINTAVKAGYMSGLLDGRFHPEEGITYAHAYTALVKALGYTDSDLPGIWPDNYLAKAEETGITDGLNFSGSNNIPRWAGFILFDNLLKVPVKSNESISLGENSGLFSECIILGNSLSSDALSKDEVLTDKGVLFFEDAKSRLQLGCRYWLKIKDDAIEGIISNVSNPLNISVESVNGMEVTYKEESILKILGLPGKTTYYYNGKVQNYENISKLLQVCSSIVLEKNASDSGYEYVVIFDPVYSKPEIASHYNRSERGIGSIKFAPGAKITRNGSMISIREIEDKDAVYQVSDIWGQSKYFLVIDNKIEGKIKAILPSKISPASVEIAGKTYELSVFLDIDKINNRGMFQVGDNVTLVLGHDGNVVDIIGTLGESNSNYALVLNNFSEKSDSVKNYGTEQFFVKLLHTDGTTEVYRMENEELGYNGELVKYTVKKAGKDEEYNSVMLEKVETLDGKEYQIDKIERKIDDNYISDNVKIFNIVTVYSNSDSEAYMMNWSDMPNGAVPAGKIKYLNKTGAFGDINVILAENIHDEGIRQGIIVKMDEKRGPANDIITTSTILIDGKEYTTNSSIAGIYLGAVVKLRMSNDRITSIEKFTPVWTYSSKADAIDSTRIKINDTIYKFSNNITIYHKDFGTSYSVKGINDIVPGELYGKISIYLDKAPKYGGKVEIITVLPY